MNKKLGFRPGRCENPDCRKWTIDRTNWLSIERGFGRGHGYHVCQICADSPIPDEHNAYIHLIDIANGLWLHGYEAVKVGWKGKMLSIEEAQDIARQSPHSCGYCQVCPTHGY